jgi:hypothetical protein
VKYLDKSCKPYIEVEEYPGRIVFNVYTEQYGDCVSYTAYPPNCFDRLVFGIQTWEEAINKAQKRAEEHLEQLLLIRSERKRTLDRCMVRNETE